MIQQFDLKKIPWSVSNQFHLINDHNSLFYIPSLLHVLLTFELVVTVLGHDCAQHATFFQKFEAIF